MKKKITLPRAGSGGSRQRRKVCQEPPRSGSRQSGFSHLTVLAQPRKPRKVNRFARAHCRRRAARASPPPQPDQPAPSRHVRPRASAAAAGPPQPHHARPLASRPRTPTTQSFVPPPQAEERGGVARRPLPQAVLHPPPEGHRVSTLPHSSFFPKRLPL